MAETPIRPIRVASRKAAANEDVLIREAILGEANWGQYGHDALTNAAGGALAGGIAGAGIFSPEGAAIGAAGGAAFGIGSDMVKDAWYNTRSDVDKASWQAGDCQDRVEKLAGFLNKANPTLGQALTALGAQFKQFIDAYVQKKPGIDISKNMFSPTYVQPQQPAAPAPQAQYPQQAQQYAAPQAQYEQPQSVPYGHVASRSPKFVRLAQTPPNTQMPDAVQNLGASGAQMAVGAGAQNLVETGLKSAIGYAAEHPQSLLKGFGFNMIGTMGTDMALGGLERLTKGDRQMITEQVGDIQKVLTVVNGLSKNDPAVVGASEKMRDTLQEVVQMSQQADAQAAQPQPAQPQQQAPEQPQSAQPQQAQAPPTDAGQDAQPAAYQNGFIGAKSNMKSRRIG
jgi:hypothetical protein